MRLVLIVVMLVLLGVAGCLAGEVTVVDAVAVRESAGLYRLQVTLEHADAGWKHYADRWEVLSPTGELLATRTLYHPHDKEQPFTRSLAGVEVPKGVRAVYIRAHDSVHGNARQLFEVKLP